MPVMAKSIASGMTKADDKRRSPPKQSEKDENDEQCPFDKISFHRLDGAVHEFAAVIEPE